MKAIMVMYDSLNRHMLPNYGCDWTLAPNFARLADRVVAAQEPVFASQSVYRLLVVLRILGRDRFDHRRGDPLHAGRSLHDGSS